MASPMVFVLALMGGCVLAQAHYIPETANKGLEDFLPDKYFQGETAAATPFVNVPECLQAVVAGYYLARNAWDLRNQWVAIPQQRLDDLENCKKEPESEQAGCMERVEQWARDERTKVYRSGAVLGVGGVIIGFKVKEACLSS